MEPNQTQNTMPIVQPAPVQSGAPMGQSLMQTSSGKTPYIIGGVALLVILTGIAYAITKSHTDTVSTTEPVKQEVVATSSTEVTTSYKNQVSADGLSEQDKKFMVQAIFDFKALLESKDTAKFIAYAEVVYPEAKDEIEDPSVTQAQMKEGMAGFLKEMHLDTLTVADTKNMIAAKHDDEFGVYLEASEKAAKHGWQLTKHGSAWYVAFNE